MPLVSLTNLTSSQANFNVVSSQPDLKSNTTGTQLGNVTVDGSNVAVSFANSLNQFVVNAGKTIVEFFQIQPSQPQATSNSGTGSATITWTEANGGQCGVSNYTIFRGTDPSNLVAYQTVSNSTFSFTDTPLTGHQAFYYEVVANSNSCGSSTGSVLQFAGPATRQDVQTFCSAVSGSNSGINLVMAAVVLLIIGIVAAIFIVLFMRGGLEGSALVGVIIASAVVVIIIIALITSAQYFFPNYTITC